LGPEEGTCSQKGQKAEIRERKAKARTERDPKRGGRKISSMLRGEGKDWEEED